ncbi:hypothetical protein AJ78_08751 [Emergomyces pasteurianus Ep9510]|uniref:Uncharacterized protein n=1 Tax=Emergomyces pasteurianus Ep9510 TaxID=1447872 RepID=A0A1J9NZW2_9EURO|nr:hypothetical protein AJ78_08751 [Emergomyces pasteurianus Ep9510]
MRAVGRTTPMTTPMIFFQTTAVMTLTGWIGDSDESDESDEKFWEEDKLPPPEHYEAEKANLDTKHLRRRRLKQQTINGIDRVRDHWHQYTDPEHPRLTWEAKSDLIRIFGKRGLNNKIKTAWERQESRHVQWVRNQDSPDRSPTPFPLDLVEKYRQRQASAPPKAEEQEESPHSEPAVDKTTKTDGAKKSNDKELDKEKTFSVNTYIHNMCQAEGLNPQSLSMSKRAEIMAAYTVYKKEMEQQGWKDITGEAT